MPGERLDEQTMALRVAKEFQDGMVVNLGVGIPTLCSNFVPAEREIVFQSENGILGFGPIVTDPDEADENLINAGGQPVQPKPGMAGFDHAESFVMIRGGHVDLAVLGALEVSERGDLANYTLPGKQVGSFGGGQDLAFCAKKLVAVMTHTTREGKPKIVKECSLPLTSLRPVDLVVTELAVIAFPDGRATLVEMAPDVTVKEVVANTEAELNVPQHVPHMSL